MWCRAEVIEHPHLAATSMAPLQAACDVIDAGFAGVGQAQAIAQLRGDGRSQRAAGAMCVQWRGGRG